MSANVFSFLGMLFNASVAQREEFAANERRLSAERSAIVFRTDLEGQITEGAESLQMTNSQQATASIKITDKRGDPARVDGIPAWAVSDETIISVTPAEDGMSALVKATGPLGEANISVTADADLGEGVKSIFGTLRVGVTQGEAVGIELTLGEPTEQ